MKPAHKVLAGVVAATALLSGGTIGQVRYESRPVYAEAYPTSFGVIDAIDVVRTGDDENNNSAAGTILGGVIGGVLGHQIGSGRGNDAATVAGAIGGAVVGHEIGEDRSGATSYRIRVRLDSGDHQSFLQDDPNGLRVGDRIQVNNDHVFRYVANKERYDAQDNRVDERGSRDDAQGFWVDERGIRHEYQDPPRTYQVPPRN